MSLYGTPWFAHETGLGTTCLSSLPRINLWPACGSTWTAMSPLVLLDIILSAKLLPQQAIYRSHRTCSFIDAFILLAGRVLISSIYPMSMELRLRQNLLEIHLRQGLLNKLPFGDMPPIFPHHHCWTFHFFVHLCHITSHWTATSLVAKLR